MLWAFLPAVILRERMELSGRAEMTPECCCSLIKLQMPSVLQAKVAKNWGNSCENSELLLPDL